MHQPDIFEYFSKSIDELKAVEILINSEKPVDTVECSVILNDQFFSWGYVTNYDKNLLGGIRDLVRGTDIVLIQFFDFELPRAWGESYLKGGIPVEKHDRRVEFHRFDDMNEMFCIDCNLHEYITGYWDGTERELTEDRCGWMFHMVEWYRAQLIQP